MVQTDDRSATDVAFANELGDSLAHLIVRNYRLNDSFTRTRVSKQLIEGAVNGVAQYLLSQNVRGFVSMPPRMGSRAHVEGVRNVLRMFGLAQSLGLDGVLVLQTQDGPLQGETTVDLLNPLAVRGLLSDEDMPEGYELVVRAIPNSAKWRRTLKEFLPRLGSVKYVDKQEAARGFLTAFVDSVRAMFQGYMASKQTNTLFTVHSGHGYQIQVYETWRYSPIVFGATKSSPVSGMLQTGYYKFQGLQSGVLTRDQGVYLAAPHSITATLGDF